LVAPSSVILDGAAILALPSPDATVHPCLIGCTSIAYWTIFIAFGCQHVPFTGILLCNQVCLVASLANGVATTV
jgi:hypothetical protein